tara:strand:+ start:2061 stop:2297 length:237 start_codon:yes stop_codon:yes gene_type:complete
MKSDDLTKKPIAAYLDLLEVQDDVKMNKEYWWSKLDQDQMLKVMQQFCWDNSIDYNMINWANFLNGTSVTKEVLWDND